MPNKKKVRGAKGSSASAAKTDIRSQANMRVDIALANGSNVGLVGGGQGIFLDGTPLVAADGSYNFVRASYVERFGLPGQAPLPGFETAAQAEYSTNTTVTYTTPFVQGTSNANIDWINVTLNFGPLYLNNGANSVAFEIDVQARDSTVWQTAIIDTFTHTLPQSVYQRDYAVARPAGTSSGNFNWRVRKTTPEPTDSSSSNTLAVGVYTEYTNGTNTYPGLAHVGVYYDAGSVGDSPPVPTFLFDGRMVRVPTTYDPTTRAYADGVWNQTFKTAWTDNPAWCLLDYLTDVDNGMGAFFDDSQINLQSFYNAAVYNDTKVAYLLEDGSTGYEPRFRLNGALNTAESGTNWINGITTVMNANCCWQGGMVTLLQDRPVDAKRLVNRSNMVWGSFVEKETSIRSRHTQVVYTYSDERDRTKPRTLTVDADADTVARYDYLVKTEDLWGVASEGQVRRKAKWLLDTEAYQSSTATWQMGRDALNFRVFDVVKVMDNMYSGVTLAGRVASITGTTVVLDRPVTLLDGVSDIDIATTDGEFETVRLNQVAGTYTTVTLSKAMTKTPNDQAVFNILSGVSPRLFRVTKISEAGASLFDIEAIAYDVNKWARVEGGALEAPAKFVNLANTSIGTPSNLAFLPQIEYADSIPRRSLVLQWQRPALGVAIGYEVHWRVNGGSWVIEAQTAEPVSTISNVSAGQFDVEVYAIGLTDGGIIVRSQALTGSTTIDVEQATGSLLNAPVNLVSSLGNTSFDGPSLSVSWTNPASNAKAPVPLKNYELQVVNGITGATVRTVDVSDVSGVGTFTYAFDQNQVDNGSAVRSIRISVRARDANNKTSAATAVTFTNAAPAAVNGIQVVSQTGGVTLSWTRNTENDLAGYLVWRGDTASFVASASTLLSDTPNFYNSFDQEDETTKYYRVAAYDSFGKPSDASGLNVSGALAGYAATSTPGIPSGTSLPTTAIDGDSFILLPANVLYTYANGAWSRVGNQSGTATQMAAAASTAKTGDVYANTTDSKLYTFNGSAWVSAVGTVNAADIQGQIDGATQIAAGTVSQTALASGLSAITNVTSLPTTNVGTTVAFNGSLYTWNGSAYTNTVAASQLAANSIDASKFSTDLVALKQVTGVPTSYVAQVIYNTADGKQYTWNGSAYTKTVQAADILGTISDSQIQSVSTTKLLGLIANSQISTVSALKLIDQITTTQIADDSITTKKLVVGSVDATIIAAGAVTTAALSVAAQSENLMLNGSFEDGMASWGVGASNVPTQVYVIDGSATGSNQGTYDGSKVGRLSRVNPGEAVQIVSRAVAVTPGNTYRLQFAYRSLNGREVGFHNAVGYSPISPPSGFIDNNFAINNGGQWFGLTTFNAVVVTNTAWAIYEAIFTVPAGQYWVSFCPHNWTFPGTWTGDVHLDVDAFTLKQVVGSTLIADGSITTAKVVAGSISSDKLMVASFSTALNSDPTFLDATAWTTNEWKGTFLRPGDAPSGQGVIDITNARGRGESNRFPLDATKTYKFSAWYRSFGNANAGAYLRLHRAGATGELGYDTGFENAQPNNDGTWRKYERIVAPEAGTNYGWIDYHGLWAGTQGTWQFADVRCEEQIGSTSIQNGAISTDKIVAGAITVDKMAANSVSTGSLQAGVVTTDKLAVGAVTAQNLAVVQQEPSLIYNPSFEEAGTKNWSGFSMNVPLGWSLDAYAGLSGGYYWGDGGTDGTKFVYLVRNSENDHMCLMSRAVSVTPGETYVLRFKYYVNGGGTQFLPYVFTRSTKPSGEFITYNSGVDDAHIPTLLPGYGAINGFPAGSPYATYEEAFVVPAGQYWLSLAIHSWNGYWTGGATYLHLDEFSLKKQVTSALIQDGSITTPKLVTGSVTTDILAVGAVTAATVSAGAISTPQLAVGAVTADIIAGKSINTTKLTITPDLTNMINDGGELASGWVSGAITQDVTNDQGWYNSWWSVLGVTSKNALRTASRDATYGNRFKIKPGDSFHAELPTVPTTGGASQANYSLGLQIFDVNGDTIGWAPICTRPAGVVGAYLATGDWTNTNTQAYEAIVWLQLDTAAENAPNTNGTSFYFTKPVMRRQTEGSLIVNGTITGNKVQALTLTGDLIQGNTITGDKIVANSVNAAVLIGGTITGNLIAAQQITGAHVQTNSLDASLITAGTITSTQLQARSITADRIRAGSITATEILANSITADRMSVGALSAITANLGAITAGTINLNSDAAGGWAYVRTKNKWYGDSINGTVIAAEPNGDSFFESVQGASGIRMHLADNNFQLWGPGFNLSNGGLTISQLNVIGEAQIAGQSVTVPGIWDLAAGQATNFYVPGSGAYTAMFTIYGRMGYQQGGGDSGDYRVGSQCNLYVNGQNVAGDFELYPTTFLCAATVYGGNNTIQITASSALVSVIVCKR